MYHHITYDYQNKIKDNIKKKKKYFLNYQYHLFFRIADKIDYSNPSEVYTYDAHLAPSPFLLFINHYTYPNEFWFTVEKFLGAYQVTEKLFLKSKSYQAFLTTINQTKFTDEALLEQYYQYALSFIYEQMAKKDFQVSVKNIYSKSIMLAKTEPLWNQFLEKVSVIHNEKQHDDFIYHEKDIIPYDCEIVEVLDGPVNVSLAHLEKQKQYFPHDKKIIFGSILNHGSVKVQPKEDFQLERNDYTQIVAHMFNEQAIKLAYDEMSYDIDDPTLYPLAAKYFWTDLKNKTNAYDKNLLTPITFEVQKDNWLLEAKTFVKKSKKSKKSKTSTKTKKSTKPVLKSKSAKAKTSTHKTPKVVS